MSLVVNAHIHRRCLTPLGVGRVVRPASGEESRNRQRQERLYAHLHAVLVHFPP